jgi:hypothetical protein
VAGDVIVLAGSASLDTSTLADLTLNAGSSLTLGVMAPGTFRSVGTLSMAATSTISITSSGSGLVLGDLANSSLAGTVIAPFGGFLGKGGPGNPDHQRHDHGRG